MKQNKHVTRIISGITAAVLALSLSVPALAAPAEDVTPAAKKKVAVKSIKLNYTAKTLKKGETVKLKATVSPKNATNKKVTWKSSKKKVATVSKSGKVKGLKKGKATITAKSGKKKAQCVITVGTPVSKVSMKKTMTLIVGKTGTLKATVTPKKASNKALAWKSGKTSVATVNSKGKVTAKKVGTAIITATAKDGSGKKATCTVTVNPVPVSGVTVSPNTATLTVGQTTQLAATVKPKNAADQSVTWKSGDESIVTVSNKGLLTGKKEGTATVTVTSNNDKKATCRVTVNSFTIVHFNDVHSFAGASETSIGYARISGIIDTFRRENPNALVLDAGDVFAGSPVAAYSDGEDLLPILDTMDIDAMTAGNSEFYYGTPHLLDLTNELKYPVFAANMLDQNTNDPLLDEYEIFTLDNGLKIGVFGVTTKDSARGLAGCKYADPVATAEKIVQELKTQQVDAIVALTHLGDNTSKGRDNTSLDLAEKVPEIDVIIDGHSHTVLPNGRVENGTLIAQTGSNSQYVGVVDVALKDEGTAATARLIDKAGAAAYPDSAATKAVADRILGDIDADLSQLVGETTVALDGSRNKVRTQEAAVGNLFMDAVRAKTGADIAMCSAGIVGGESPAGMLTRYDVMEIDRMGTSGMVVTVTGANIVEALYTATAVFPGSEENAGLVQVSGITFKVNPDVQYDSGQTNADVERVYDVKVGENPINLTQTYTVATHGSYVGNLKDFTNPQEVGKFYPMLVEYIEANAPISPSVEGRFVAEVPTP